jgi:hypothetical protein
VLYILAPWFAYELMFSFMASFETFFASLFFVTVYTVLDGVVYASLKFLFVIWIDLVILFSLSYSLALTTLFGVVFLDLVVMRPPT